MDRQLRRRLGPRREPARERSKWLAIGPWEVTFILRCGMTFCMAPAIIALTACLLFAYPHITPWVLPAYSLLLVWNGREWLALGIGILFLALRS